MIPHGHASNIYCLLSCAPGSLAQAFHGVTCPVNRSLGTHIYPILPMAQAGVGEQMVYALADETDLQKLFIDSTIVAPINIHPLLKKTGSQALGRSRGGLSTKLHVAIDALGNPLRVIPTAGQVADIACASEPVSRFGAGRENAGDCADLIFQEIKGDSQTWR